jgi:hypothetical protein
LAWWQSFFAVLMTIGIVCLLGMLSFSMLAGPGGGSTLVGLFCVGSFTLLIYGLPAVMLWKASLGARNYSRSPDSHRLVEFAASQVAFWRTIGIIAVVVVGLYGMAFVALTLFGVSAAID